MVDENQTPFIIVGLGNPGLKYRSNRHNIGFLLLDKLADHLGVKFTRMEMKALVAKTSYEQHRLVLAKPHTFMNLSGQSVSSLLHYYRAPLKQLLVVYDDVDLPLGTIRIRPGGGAGGHKGMTSIIEKLGEMDFPRLRIGIGRPPGRMEAADYVLQDFSSDEKQSMSLTMADGVKAILLYISEGLNSAMNRYNQQVQDHEL